MRKTLLAVAALSFWALTLTGCEIYFGPPGGSSDCRVWGDCDGNGGSIPPGEPGATCGSNYDCMAGCFCNGQGFCEEAGFCEAEWDCADGFECQEERASCVPVGSDGTCSADRDCPQGSFCEPAGGICIPSGVCNVESDCGPGWTCNPAGTCVPMPCTDNDQCAAGCVCDTGSSTCVETGFCTRDEECPQDMECDTARNTCTWEVSDPSCAGEVVCDVVPPTCPLGTVPAIEDGCYTGACLAINQCDVTPACEDIQHERDCLGQAAAGACGAVYSGVDCTCNGVPCSCSESPANCVCQSYRYEGCETP